MPTLNAAAHRYVPLRSSEPEDPVRLSNIFLLPFSLFDAVPGSLHDHFAMIAGRQHFLLPCNFFNAVPDNL